jgi:hypothetical protein
VYLRFMHGMNVCNCYSSIVGTYARMHGFSLDKVCMTVCVPRGTSFESCTACIHVHISANVCVDWEVW